MTRTQAEISIRIQSNPRYLCVVRDAVERAGRQMGFDEKQAGQIVLAVDEGVTNMIRHGYHDAVDQPIWINLSRVDDAGGQGICVELMDECGCVDLDRIKGRALEEVRPGGLGVNIIKQVMDHVRYDRRADGSGLMLTMVKYLREGETQMKGSE